jgi:deoxyribonuclease I
MMTKTKWLDQTAAAIRLRPLQFCVHAEQAAVPESSSPQGVIVGNQRSQIYYWPGCPSYNEVSPQNRVLFPSRQDAEAAGYRAAGNCR